MKIRDILAKHYDEFREMLLNADTIVYGGKTSEDILNDSIITIINHYGDEDIDEEEGYQYAKKTFLMEEQFSWNKKSWDKEKMLIFIGLFPPGS